jgi:pseudouridylate synthase
MEPFLLYADDVARALDAKMPVVALESSILAHGMPRPRNLETARTLERIVRDAGATPATIAVLDGAIHVGLRESETERVATEPMLKLGRADLAFALATGASGATTVAATTDCAALAGIAVFATGGIGGVHRGSEETMDVSGDLEALATTPVTVVCSGAKAILDLRKTLEYLETRGIPVVGYRTAEFPAFWSRSSGLSLTSRLDAPVQIARLVTAQRALGLRSGIVVANPIDVGDEIAASEIERHIEAALREADAAGVRGKRLTPWLLDRILALTNGRSLEANIALVCANAKLAAQIAIALPQ